jgi:uncharacterized damage-inducible protein DinB
MAEFVKQDFSGARFEQVDFSRAWFRNVYFTGATLRGAWLEDVDIDGEIRNVRINGVDIVPLVEAELNRRYPDRAKLDPVDPAGFREAWAIIERVWPPTIEWARRLPPELLHERVEGEWSFIETLRHLVFATDAWVRRAILGLAEPYSPLGLRHDEMEPDPSVPNDPDARPSLDEMLELRADRMRTVHDVIATLTDDALGGQTDPVPQPGYPPPGSYPVRRCLRTIVNEEWLHRLYAERDLATLGQRVRLNPPPPPAAEQSD